MADLKLARHFRKTQTWAEKLVWKWLRDRRFSLYKFRRQHPLDVYYLDFFCEEARLSIELDGGQHGFPEQREHDAERERVLISHGIKTLRLWNSQLRRNSQSIRDSIHKPKWTNCLNQIWSTVASAARHRFGWGTNNRYGSRCDLV